jgi:drug/metabolite transporter (DMT)-like permease
MPICWRKLKKTISDMSGRDFALVLLQALFGMFLFRMFFLNGIRLTSTGEAGILTGATPAVTSVLAVIFLKEPAGRRKFSGILCTVAGVIILQDFLSGSGTFSMGHFWGNMLILCAAASESMFNILSRIFAVKVKSRKEKDFSPIVQTTIVSALTLVLCLVPAALEQTSVLSPEIGRKEWFSLFWYGVVVTALAFICWYSGIKRCGAIIAAAFSGMMPFTAMLLSIVILGEKPGWQKCLGGALIIVGMIIIGTGSSGDKLRQKGPTDVNAP